MGAVTLRGESGAPFLRARTPLTCSASSKSSGLIPPTGGPPSSLRGKAHILFCHAEKWLSFMTCTVAFWTEPRLMLLAGGSDENVASFCGQNCCMKLANTIEDFFQVRVGGDVSQQQVLSTTKGCPRALAAALPPWQCLPAGVQARAEHLRAAVCSSSFFHSHRTLKPSSHILYPQCYNYPVLKHYRPPLTRNSSTHSCSSFAPKKAEVS